MRTETLFFNDRYRLSYRPFVTRYERGSSALPGDELLAAAARLRPDPRGQVVLSGGSPLEHPQFWPVIERLRADRHSNLHLETDGPPLALPGAVERLLAAGVRRFSVFAGAVTAATHERLYRQPGSLEAWLEGLRTLLEYPLPEGVKVYVILPVLRSNREELGPFLDWMFGLSAKPAGVLLDLPRIEQVPQALRQEVLSGPESAALAEDLFTRLRYKRVEYGFALKRGISPCTAEGKLNGYGTVFHDRITWYKHAREKSVQRVAACESCVLSHACEGLETAYAQTFGEEHCRPVDLDTALGWQLRAMNSLDSIDYHQISAFNNEIRKNDMSLVRVNGHCNMACSFCFVDRTVGDTPVATILAEIQRFWDEGTRHLIISGGEPTLHPQLPEIIAGAREIGLRSIEMQSNGVRCADEDYARSLAEAGLTLVTISLHSIDAERSDSITRLPRAHGKTLQAMHNFRKLGVRTQIACVITKLNYPGLPEYIRHLRQEFPEHGGHLSICFAIAQGISDLVFEWVIPRFSDIRPYFQETLDYCLETGVGFGGLIGQGGYPPCMLGGDLRYYLPVMDKNYRSEDHTEQFYKAPRCQECSFNPYCVGVRRAYIEAYGDAEISPFRSEEQLAQLVEKLGAR